VTTADLDALAEDTIRAAGAIPSFKGYHGFPASICSSVNSQIVHAIPSPAAVLAEGDLISIDCGAILDGWHGDAAITVSGRRGQARAAEDGQGRRRLDVGRHHRRRARVISARGRLTDISHAIQTTIKNAGRYGIVDGYGGHGIGTEMHQDPHVLNHGRAGRGPALVPGMALAIEPMITLGSPRTVEQADGWTVVTKDGSVAVHVEHTVAFFDDGVWVTTAADGGVARLGDPDHRPQAVILPGRRACTRLSCPGRRSGAR